jgi:putative ABC transport system permease protein
MNSLKNLAQNKIRSLITALGIIIGVSSVITIIAIGDGAQNLILSQVKTFGSTLVGVLPGKSEEKGPPASVFGIVITTLTYEDALAVKDPRNAPHVVEIVAYAKGSETVSYQGNQITATVNGTNTGYLLVEKGEVALGRFFSDSEDKSVAKVATLGATVAKDLFGDNDPVGRNIKIKNQPFEVIGVMKAKGTVGFQSYDDQVYVPIKTMQKIILGIDHISMMRAMVDEEANVPEAVANIEQTLRERHGITDSSGANDDFTVRSAAQALDMITTITNALKYFLAAMAALSLLVGGIGIMNIMLIRVSQRTREIGLRKAVGANNEDIRLQFLVESSVITLSGGLVGIIIGELASFVIAIVANGLGYDWGFHFSWFSIVLSVTISIAIGVGFGLYPAFKAGKLNPIEALRYE